MCRWKKLKKAIYFEVTSSLAVAWSTVQLILILAITKQLKMQQVEYVQAFTPALLDDDGYMHIPTGLYYDNQENNNHKVL